MKAQPICPVWHGLLSGGISSIYGSAQVSLIDVQRSLRDTILSIYGNALVSLVKVQHCPAHLIRPAKGKS
jgi:hypothetical protein